MRAAVCLAVCVTLVIGTPQTRAADAPQPRVLHAVDNSPYLLWRESWGGGEMLANSWTVYTGSTFALTGDIEQPGWRLRTTGGYGQYTYSKWSRRGGGPEHLKFTGRKVFSDALIGHHWQWHRLTLKAFGGITSERHIVDPRDGDNPVTAFSYGGKAALESWLSISDKHWLAADLSWSSAFNTYKLGLRTGYAVFKNVDLGIESRFEGNDAFEAGRIGGFATWKIGDAGLTAAAGVTGDRDRQTSHYGSLNLFFRY